MTAGSRKAYRDAWQERTRSAFVIITIAAGVTALLALLASYAVLVREINRGYLATNPASAILHTDIGSDAIDSQTIASVLADPEIGAAEARRTVYGRIKTGPAQWHELLLFVIPNYRDMRLNKFIPEQGAWPPATGDVLIERDAFQVARTKIGDRLLFRIGNGPTQTLRVSGRVHDVGQAQARMENSVYGYITVETLARMGEKPVFDSLLIQVAHDKYNEAHIRQVTERLKQRLEREGHQVTRVEFPVPRKHPHADLMGALLLAISSFGFFLLLLSGVLALNFTAALMSAQIRQIGIMKAVGGSRRQIARIYLLQSLLLGGVATVLAIPFGVWCSQVLCRYLATFLNFDITSFSIPAWVFLVALGCGVAVPVVACSVPVWRAVTMPVRRALASTGVTSENFGLGWVERMLAGVGGGTRPVLLAVRNSFRRRVRFALTCLALICAGTFFMAALDLRISMIKTFDRLFAAAHYDLTVNLEEMYPVDKIDGALHGVPGVLASEDWIAADGWLPQQHTTTDEAKRRFSVIARPADSKLFFPVMAQGRSLHAGDIDSIILNPTMAAQNPQMKVGDQVLLHIGDTEKRWRVVGICREPMLPPPIVYVPISAFEQTHLHTANLVAIALEGKERGSLELAREQIDPRLEREGIHVAGAGSRAEFRFAVDQHVLMIYVFLVIASCIVGVVGGLGLTTTMAMNILERRREIGVLRAIGASPRMICAIVIGEAVTIAVLAWGAAVLLAFPLTNLLTSMIGRLLHGTFDFNVAPVGIVIALAASAVVGALASIVAAHSAVRLTVREALAYE